MNRERRKQVSRAFDLVGKAKGAVEMARKLFLMADREIFLVVSLDSKLEPMAAEIASVGGVESCAVDMRSVFKHAILNNASFVICLHNHPSGDPENNRADCTGW